MIIRDTLYLTKHLFTYRVEKYILFFNTLNFAIDIVDRNIGEMILKKEFKKVPPAILKTLMERKYIYSNNKEEAEYKRNLIEKISNQRTSIVYSPYIYFCITYKCNFNCIYCILDIQKKNNLKMKPPHIEKIMKFLKDHNIRQGRHWIIYGGEPLLEENYDTLFCILQYAQKNTQQVDIITNGYNVHRFIHLFTNFRRHIDTFIITLDGPPNIHDNRRIELNTKSSFLKIVKNISLLLEKGFKIEIQMIVDKQNINSIPDLAEFFIRKGWDKKNLIKFYIGKVTYAKPLSHITYPFYLSESEYIKSLSKIDAKGNSWKVFNLFTGERSVLGFLHSIFERKRPPIPSLNGCRASIPGVLIFAPDGYIYPCVETICDKKKSIARYFPSFYLNHKEYHFWKNYNILKLSPCKDCNYLFICRGGCPLIRHQFNKKYCINPNIEKTIHTYIAWWYNLKFKNT